MTFLFSWLHNPIWFVRVFVISTVLVLLMSFFSYRQIRGQLGFASPAAVMSASQDNEPTTLTSAAAVAVKPTFDPVNRNRDHLQNVCRVKPIPAAKPKRVPAKKQPVRSIYDRNLLKRERARQRAAQETVQEQCTDQLPVSQHIITHNGKIRYVTAGASDDQAPTQNTRIVAPKKIPKQRATRSRVAYNGSFSLPIKRSQFWLSSPFGPRRKANGRRGFHKGVDLAAVRGTPVMAAGDGVVVFAGNGGPYGNLVIIEHDERCRTWYAHMSAIKTNVGQQVSVGRVVGLVGATGYVRKRRGGSGDHLHFGMYIDGRAVNPVHYLS